MILNSYKLLMLHTLVILPSADLLVVSLSLRGELSAFRLTLPVSLVKIVCFCTGKIEWIVLCWRVINPLLVTTPVVLVFIAFAVLVLVWVFSALVGGAILKTEVPLFIAKFLIKTKKMLANNFCKFFYLMHLTRSK